MSPGPPAASPVGRQPAKEPSLTGSSLQRSRFRICHGDYRAARRVFTRLPDLMMCGACRAAMLGCHAPSGKGYGMTHPEGAARSSFSPFQGQGAVSGFKDKERYRAQGDGKDRGAMGEVHAAPWQLVASKP